jgi:hypothetical protein
MSTQGLAEGCGAAAGSAGAARLGTTSGARHSNAMKAAATFIAAVIARRDGIAKWGWPVSREGELLSELKMIPDPKDDRFPRDLF